MKFILTATAILFFCTTFAQTQTEVQKIELEVVDEEASFPGGTAALTKFIYDNLHYPDMSTEIEIHTKIYFSFSVNTDGTLSDIQIVNKTENCPECDAEALRIIHLMPKWIPAKKDGKNVISKCSIPIIINLE